MGHSRGIDEQAGLRIRQPPPDRPKRRLAGGAGDSQPGAGPARRYLIGDGLQPRAIGSGQHGTRAVDAETTGKRPPDARRRTGDDSASDAHTHQVGADAGTSHPELMVRSLFRLMSALPPFAPAVDRHGHHDRRIEETEYSRWQWTGVPWHGTRRTIVSRRPPHGHDERLHHILAPPTADLGLRAGSAMLHAGGRTANQPSSDAVRQIVGVVAVVRGRASDDGFSRLLLLRADDGTRTARLVREVIFQVRAGFRDRVRQMIAHGSPPQDRHLQYEPVAGSTASQFHGTAPRLSHLREPGRAAGSRQNVPPARHPSLRHIAQRRAIWRLTCGPAGSVALVIRAAPRAQ